MRNKIKPKQIMEVLEHLNEVWKPEVTLKYLIKKYREVEAEIKQEGENE